MAERGHNAEENEDTNTEGEGENGGSEEGQGPGSEGINYLELSDEELMKLPPPEIGENEGTGVGSQVKSPRDHEEDRGSGEGADDPDANSNAEAAGQEGAGDSAAKKEGEGKPDGDQASSASGKPGTPGKTKEGKPSKDGEKGTGDVRPGQEAKAGTTPPAGEKDTDSGNGDAKAGQDDNDPAKTAEGAKPEPQTLEEFREAYGQLKQLMEPFKANGRTHQPKSLDDARALMQMGANYNWRMAGLKPHLKLLKMLEHNQLLDESKLNFLVDVSEGKPEAISKLLKDKNLDLMDLDSSKAGDYKQSIRPVGDNEIDLDRVLDELKGSEQYTRLLTVAGKEWDEKSRAALTAAPENLRVLSSHMEHGVFDMVMKEMTNARTMGRLSNLSDLEAYKHVGDELDRAGAFAHLVKPNKASTEAKPVTQQERLPASSNTVLPKSQGAQEDESLRNKRRAAGASKTTAGAGGTGANPNFNPLAMSDDEFSKLSANRFR